MARDAEAQALEGTGGRRVGMILKGNPTRRGTGGEHAKRNDQKEGKKGHVSLSNDLGDKQCKVGSKNMVRK
jgi:hypothetical protein